MKVAATWSLMWAAGGDSKVAVYRLCLVMMSSQRHNIRGEKKGSRWGKLLVTCCLC